MAAGPLPLGAYAPASSFARIPVLRALEGRRFRAILLAVLALPLAAGYLWQTLIQPILDPGYDPKDWWVYLDAAAAIRHGADPYASFFAATVSDPLFNRGYVYPPLLAWALQPLAGWRGHSSDVAELLFLHACLAASMVVLLVALRVRSRAEIALLCLLAASWYPVRIDLMGQVNLVLLLLTCLWFLAHTRRLDAVGGAALGVAAALKLFLGPLALLNALRGRWAALAAAAAGGSLLWAIALPERLPEYLGRVLPLISGGTGYRENQAPTGTISRILHPASLHGQAGALPLDVRILAGAVSLLVVLHTWRTLRRGSGSGGRAAAREAALVLAALPLVLSMQSPSQYVTLLIPLALLAHEGIARRDPRLLLAAGACYLLTGPVHTAYLYAIATGVPFDPWLRVATETGLAGLVAVYAGCLALVRCSGGAARDPG